MMDGIVSWLHQHRVPDENPEDGWGAWMVGLTANGADVVARPTEEFRQLVLQLDDLAERDQTLDRYIGQIEPLAKYLAQAQSGGVRIMTMGGAKGLTTRATIVVGVEDGLVPRPHADLSEERRILYVAMTRPTDYLFCTWARRRRGPSARAGAPTMARRRHSHFLDDGPVESQDGRSFLDGRFGHV